jgi:hypothetical protein
MPLPMPQQSSVLFQQPSSASQQQQVVLCSSPQYQTFNISDLGSSSSPSHSPPQPPPPPQLPSYSHSLGVQNYKQVYHRTSPQQQAGFPSFCLPTSQVTVSHSPTPGSEPPNLCQSVTAAPTLKSPSLRSNSLPGLQDDTFIMPKVSIVVVLVWDVCLCDICTVLCYEPQLYICEFHRCFYGQLGCLAYRKLFVNYCISWFSGLCTLSDCQYCH